MPAVCLCGGRWWYQQTKRACSQLQSPFGLLVPHFMLDPYRFQQRYARPWPTHGWQQMAYEAHLVVVVVALGGGGCCFKRGGRIICPIMSDWPWQMNMCQARDGLPAFECVAAIPGCLRRQVRLLVALLLGVVGIWVD